jgi:hypothetical protein
MPQTSVDATNPQLNRVGLPGLEPGTPRLKGCRTPTTFVAACGSAAAQLAGPPLQLPPWTPVRVTTRVTTGGPKMIEFLWVPTRAAPADS